MSRSTGEIPGTDQDKDLQRRIWRKVRSSARVDDSYIQRGAYDALPSYALPEALEFIDRNPSPDCPVMVPSCA